MITDIRKHFQTSTFRYFMYVSVAAIAGLFSLPNLLRRGMGADRWFARIDDNTISYRQFYTEFRQKEQQLAMLRQQYGEYADILLSSMGIDPNPQALAADSLIRETLIDQAGQAIKLDLHKDFIASQMRGNNQEVAGLIPPYAIDQFGNIDHQILKESLARQGMSVADFEAKLERVLRRSMITKMVSGSVHVPQFDVDRQLIADHAPKRFELLRFSFDTLLKKEKETALTQDEIKAYFDRQNQQYKRYWVAEKRDANVWEFTPKSYGISISQKEIERYYNDNKTRKFVDEPTQVQVRRIVFATNNEQDLDTIRAKAEQVRTQLANDPSLFAQKAKELSADVSAKNGGLMPYFARGEHDQAFEKAAFLLKSDNAISQVIQTEHGYEIVQRVARKKQSYTPLSTVKGAIEKELERKQFAKLFAKETKQLSRKFKSKGQALDEFVTQKSGKKQAINGIVKGEDTRSKTVFSLKKNSLGSYVQDGIGYIVHMTHIEKRRVAQLEDVTTTVKEDLYVDRARRALKAQVGKAKELAQQSSLSQIKSQFDARFEKTEQFTPSEGDDVKKLQEKELPAYRMLALDKEGAAIAQDTPDGAYVIQLSKIDKIDSEKLSELKVQTRVSLQGRRHRTTMDGFVASLYRNATIKMNDSLLRPA